MVLHVKDTHVKDTHVKDETYLKIGLVYCDMLCVVLHYTSNCSVYTMAMIPARYAFNVYQPVTVASFPTAHAFFSLS